MEGRTVIPSKKYVWERFKDCYDDHTEKVERNLRDMLPTIFKININNSICILPDYSKIHEL